MDASLRFVFDTNAIISAVLLKRSVSRRAFDKAVAEGRLLVSVELVDELNEVLGRPDFAKYVTDDERLEFLAALLREAELVEVTECVSDCRDPRDNKILELAVSGQVACIVSGDHDLLVLHPFRGIPVMTPRDFLARVWQAQD